MIPSVLYLHELKLNESEWGNVELDVKPLVPFIIKDYAISLTNTSTNSESTPDPSWLNPNQTDPIYSIKTRSKGFQEELDGWF